MTPALWDLYLRLQTTLAYPEGSTETNFGVVDFAIDRVLDYTKSTGHVFQHMLLVGPGGKDEILLFRNRVEGELHVLSAHEGETKAADDLAINITPAAGDMHDMPYAAQSFDFVFASNVLEHALSPYIALMEIRRVMRQRGVAYFVLPGFECAEGGTNPFHLHCLTENVWSELLKKTGFVGPCFRQDADAGYYLHYFMRAETPMHPHERVLQAIEDHKK